MAKVKLNVSIQINAPREKVWAVITTPETYTQWTASFDPTSHFIGDWSEGSKMYFMGFDEETKSERGMVSRIAKNIPYEFISIEHMGLIAGGVEDTTSEEAKVWAPAFENYTLTERDGGTEFALEQDMEEEYLEVFKGMWEHALPIIKELSEK